MRLGILSMQRVKNWGSFLQAFALKKTIEELGHECSFLDIKVGVGVPPEEMSGRKRNCTIFPFFRNAFCFIYYFLKGELSARLKGRAYQKEFGAKYNKEFLPLLGIDEFKYEDNKSFDLVVIGSDEVFNCTQPSSPWAKTLHFFGEGIDAKKIITYAASFGYTAMDDLERHGLKGRIANALKNVSILSVRDMNSYSIIEQLTGKSPELCVDPAIIFDFGPYMPKEVPDKDYLVVYTYRGRVVDPGEIKAIKDFAKSKNKKLISLYCYYDWCDKSVIADTPFELLSYFANADYVVTDTFHGSIFSMKFNRDFCTIVRNTNTQKIGFLLHQFKLSDRIAKTPADIKCVLEQSIDYANTNSVIEAETIKAKAYLRKAISLG